MLEQLEPRVLLSNTAPVLLSIDRATPAGPTTQATSVTYDVTFSEPVTGVIAGAFQLAPSPGVSASPTLAVFPANGYHSVYTVTVSDISGNGTLGLNMVNSAGIVDAFGVPAASDSSGVLFQAPTSYAVGSGPSSVASGDFNNDGRLDVVTANYWDDNVSVLLGNGNGTFQAAVNYAAGSGPESVAIGDVDGDGKADLATADYGSDRVSVLLGKGDGTFQAAASYDVGSSPTFATLGDFNSDGAADLVVVRAGDTVSILLSNGDGTFQAQVDYGVGSAPQSVTTGDVNGDGKTDLVTANYSDSVSVLLGNGDGTFQAAVNSAAGSYPECVSAGDFNGDGAADLAVGCGNDTVSILLSNRDGTFQAVGDYAPGRLPDAVATSDLNGDGKADLTVANSGSDKVSVLLGNGDGTFQDAADYLVEGPGSVTMGDFDGDGSTDLVTTDNSDSVSLLLGNRDGTFRSASNYAVGSAPQSIAVEDYNGDGWFDLATANVNDDNVSVLLGNGDGTFQDAANYAVGSHPYSVTEGDFNADGWADLATADQFSASISVLLGNGDGTFQAAVSYAVGTGPRSITVGDFDGDGGLDLATVNYGTDNVSVLLGNGDGTFQAAVDYDTMTEPQSITMGDFDGDGSADLATTNPGTYLSVLLNNGDGTFRAPVNYSVGYQPFFVSVGDFNGDGRADLATANNGRNSVSVLLGKGDGTFQTAVNYPVGSVWPRCVIVGDFNNDGNADLATANYGGNNVSVLLGKGDGTFEAAANYDVGYQPTSVAAGDFNVDGKADLAVANPHSVSILLNVGTSTFVGQVYVVGEDAQPQSLSIGSPEHGLIATPFGADAWPFTASAGTQMLLKVLGTSVASIRFTLTGPDGYTAFQDVTTNSPLVTLPASGQYVLSVHANGSGGAYSFELDQITVTPLTLGTTYNGTFIGGTQAELFRVDVPADKLLHVVLADSTIADSNEVYLRFGLPPTRSEFDYRYSAIGSANQDVVALDSRPGAWYVLVYSAVVPATSDYVLMATAEDVAVTSVSPTRTGTDSNTVITLTGARLGADTTVALVAADDTAYPASAIQVISPRKITATLDAGSVPAGVYSLRVTKPGVAPYVMPDVFTVVQGGLPHLVTSVSVPNPIGFHIASTVYVTYSNTGDGAMPAPLLVLSATLNEQAGAFLTLDASKQVSGFWTSATPDGYSHSVQFFASGSTPGLLQPGESVTVPVYYAGWEENQWDWQSPIIFSLGVLDETDTQIIYWPSLKQSLRPASLNPTAWDAIWPALTDQLGSTWGEYVQKLDSDAQYLAGIGESVTDISRLFGFEIQQASGYSPLASLASATDAQVAAPGLPVSFVRTFAPGIIQRNQFGRLGWGWTDSWNTYVTVDSDGSVNVYEPSGSIRRFQPDSRGGYFAQAGDHGTLTHAGGGYLLAEGDGQVTAYNADGTLAYLQDSNGNRITAGYTGGLLTSLTHSSGQSLTFTYNAAGLVATITDSAGRTTTYNYDPSNQYLLSVIDFDGRTTSYTYDTGSNPTTAHALLSVTRANGSHDYYSYDARGRLADVYRDNGAEDTTFAYEDGRVAVANAFGDTTNYFFDDHGLLVRVENPLHNTISFAYDNNFDLVRMTDAAGQTYTNEYDARGNLLGSTDPLGHTIKFTYSSILDRLTSITDSAGNTTHYGYDGNGNLTQATYADGTVQSVAYDPVGNVLSTTNRRGQAIQFTYDAAGNVLSETFPDSSQIAYAYDVRGNLISASDPSGTTTLAYDANDRLTQITYPSGRYLQYSYDSAGRRSQMADQTDYTVNYQYDSVGRLAGLTDATGTLIVAYTYCPYGKLIREDDGNGAYTTYAYDAAGQLLHMVNHASDETVNSRFDYTYDILGRRITEATLDGAWTYSYDAVGELTHAVFASTNPAIPDQDEAYVYDAAGNRTQTIINGETTAYATNNMNEYTQVGGTTYSYDADGNMTSATNADGTTTYTFDAQNQLTALNGPAGSWSYQYDAFGNRVATTANGVTTNYVIDPSGFGNVVGEYDAAGALVAQYNYGFTLVSRTDADGSSAYYAFDAVGSTATVTDSSGAVLNSYVYDPFGTSLSQSQALLNSFQFIGGYGITGEANGLNFARARFYDPASGRFVSADPLALAGGDANLYRYSKNDPISHIDPAGERIAWQCGPSASLNPSWSLGISLGASDGCLVGFSAGASTGVEFGPEVNLGPSVHVGPQVPGIGGVGVASAGAGIGASLGVSCGVSSGFSAGLGYGGGSQWSCGLVSVPELPPTPPPNPPSSPSGAGGSSTAVTSTDPNAKVGPAGYGPQGFISVDGVLPYRVDFENDPAAAAPAQRVVISDQLDASLDWNTLRFTAVGFGDNIITIPPDSQHYQTTVPMTYGGQTFDVDVEAGVHLDTGQVYVTFQSLDPDTDLPPSDVLVGFLPPEDGTGRGQGYVSYTVSPKANLATGTQIRNVADISFDNQTFIATDQVSETDPTQGVDPSKECLITIDAASPASSVTALPTTETSTSFNVNWSGQDDAGGSGIASYDVYVQKDGGDWTLWLDHTTDTQAAFDGVNGSTYSFCTLATDNVGNVESHALSAETTTTITSGLELVIGDGPGAQARAVVYVDADGTMVTVLLKGGTSTVTLQGDNVGQSSSKKGITITGDNLEIGQIALTETSAESMLAIKTKMSKTPGDDGLATIGQVTGAGEMGKLLAKTTDLNGAGIIMTGEGVIGLTLLHDILGGADVTMPGAGMAKGVKFQAGSIAAGSDVTFGSPLKSFSAAQWTDSSLTAPYVASLTIKGDRKRGLPGDFGASVTLTEANPRKGVSLKSAKIVGSVTGGTWTLAGTAGSISAAQWSAGAIQAGGLNHLVIKGNKKAGLEGDFGASLVLTGGSVPRGKQSLGSLAVSGTWDGAELTVHGIDAKKGLSVGAIKVGAMGDVTVNADGGVGSITTSDWTFGGINAGWLGKLSIKASKKAGLEGDFGASLVLTGDAIPTNKPTLGAANVAGDILAGSNWNVQLGTVGSLIVKGTVHQSIIRSAGNVKKITIGASEGSDFGAGVGMELLQRDRHVAPGNQPVASIGAFTVKGLKVAKGEAIPRFFANSFISAGVGKLRLLNWDDQGGLFASTDDIGLVKYRDTADKSDNWVWPAPPNQTSSKPDDFVHIV